MAQFDVVVIGAGSSGHRLAILAAQRGLSTAVIDQQVHLGGRAVNHGQIARQVLLQAATARRASKPDRSMIDQQSRQSWSQALEQAGGVSGRLRESVQLHLRKNKVTVYQGKARVLDDLTVTIGCDAEDIEPLAARAIVVATGSLDQASSGLTLDGRVITESDLLQLPEPPSAVVLTGDSGRSLEWAYILRSFGVAVTILSGAERLLPMADREVSAQLQRWLRADQTDRLFNAAIASLADDGRQLSINLTDQSRRELRADYLVCLDDPVPNLEAVAGIDLALGASSTRGIVTDQFGHSSHDRIWAVGSVCDGIGQSAISWSQAMVVADQLAGRPSEPVKERLIPKVVGGGLPVAWFGLTEDDARSLGVDWVKSKLPLSASPIGWIDGGTQGFIKLICAQPHHEILGAHLVGPGAEQLLPELLLAATWDLSADELAVTLQARGSIAEALRDVAAGVSGPMLHY
jgi:dihydrolipoamide dehydrogenase